MRKIHRWLAVIFGLLILWIAATGVITQSARLYASGEPERARAAGAAPAPTVAKAPTAKPPEAPRPTQTPLKTFVHFITELHSGEQFGVAGELISLVSGLALIFFAVSGMWMYLQMFRARARKAHGRGGRVFW